MNDTQIQSVRNVYETLFVRWVNRKPGSYEDLQTMHLPYGITKGPPTTIIDVALDLMCRDKPPGMLDLVYVPCAKFAREYCKILAISPMILSNVIYTAVTHSEKMDTLDAFVAGAGPLISKIIQQMCSSAFKAESPLLYQSMQRSLENTQPMSPSETMLELANALNEANMNGAFVDPTPAHVGSIGQVHFGKWNNKDIAVKLVKKRTLMHLTEELSGALHLEIVDDMEFLVLASIATDIRQETDLAKESMNTRFAQGVYGRENISVIRVYTPEAAPNTGHLITSRAPGKSLQATLAHPVPTPGLAQSVKVLIQLWLYHALFDTGFFHADLHVGNIYVHSGQKSRELPQLHLIDFGLCGKLKKRQRCAMIHCAMCHFKMISNLSTDNRSILREFVAAIERGLGIALDKDNNVITRLESHYKSVSPSIGGAIQIVFDTISPVMITIASYGDLMRFARGLVVLQRSWQAVWERENSEEPLDILKVALPPEGISSQVCTVIGKIRMCFTTASCTQQSVLGLLKDLRKVKPRQK
jgi:hypothetical protein